MGFEGEEDRSSVSSSVSLSCSAGVFIEYSYCNWRSGYSFPGHSSWYVLNEGLFFLKLDYLDKPGEEDLFDLLGWGQRGRGD